MQLTRFSEPPTVTCHLQVVKIQIPLHSFILSLKMIICNSLSHIEALGLVFLYSWHLPREKISHMRTPKDQTSLWVV